MRPTAELFRVRRESGPGQSEVKSVELFFDLVFVFAITQLSHLLISHLSLVGALQTGLLLLAVWWVWIYTSWVTNWLDPDSLPVRLLLFVLMLAGLVLSASIPGAFEMRALPFALAYVFMQIGRSVFMLWAVKAHSEPNFRNFQRITLWLVVSGVFWIAGAFLEPSDRLIVWAVAMLIESYRPRSASGCPGSAALQRRIGTSPAIIWPSAAACS
jgi:low temperature requirement protein LtrA